MPSRTTGTPRRIPRRLILLGWLPQHKVMRVLLIRGHFDAGTGNHIVQIAPRQSAIGRIRRHIEQHMTLGGIGRASIDDRLNLGDDLVHMVRNVRCQIGRRHIQQRHI